MDDRKLTQISHYIEKARHDLLKNGNDDAGALLFMGEMQDPIPRTLIIDPVLNAVDIRIWMLLRVSIANPTLPGKLPSQIELANHIHCSKMTLWSGMQILRLNRWLTLCDRVKDEMGKNRGNVYAIHTEPMAIADTLELDPSYIDFIEQSLESKVARIKNSAMAIYISLHRQINSEYGHSFNRTQIQQQEARFSVLNITNDKSILTEEEQNYYASNFAQLEGNPDYEDDFQAQQIANESTDEIFSPGIKIVPGEKSTEYKNCTPLESTNHKNCTRLENTNHKNCTRIEMAQPRHSSPSIKIVPGEVSSCSSNIYLNTTTTTAIQEKKLKSFERFKKMIRPEEFPLVKKVFFTIPQEAQQDVLDQTLGRLVNYQKTGKGKIVNTVGFLIALRTAVNKDEFMVDSHGIMIKSGREAGERHEKVAKNPSIKITKVDTKTEPMDLEERQKGLEALNGLKRKMKF